MKTTFFYLLLFIHLLFLCGCSTRHTVSETGQVLWVVTEASCSDGMNLQAEIITKRMEKENPGLTVELDILPTDPQEKSG